MGGRFLNPPLTMHKASSRRKTNAKQVMCMSIEREEPCDLCDHNQLDLVYESEDSPRGLKVYLCAHCGLLQSLPRIDRAQRRPASVSAGADWGNVRYGKGFRTTANVEAILHCCELPDEARILDVGSNRGTFLKAVATTWPQARATAIEPDERLWPGYGDLPHHELLRARLEETDLPADSFDLIHSCHSIEHLPSVSHALADHARTLKPGGYLFLEGPNIDLLGADDIVEEWFIDKHLYHFSATTLRLVAEDAGLTVMWTSDPADLTNVALVACKEAERVHPTVDTSEPERARALIKAYTHSRSANIAALRDVADFIAGNGEQRTAVWGAGRLLNSLMVHGGLDPRNLQGLIDAHLIKHQDEVGGATLHAPADLGALNPDRIVVASRAFFDEIKSQAKTLAPDAEVISLAELMAAARAGTLEAAG